MGSIGVINVSITTKINPLVPRVLLFGFDLKENAFVVKSVRNLDVKYEIQICAYTFCS